MGARTSSVSYSFGMKTQNKDETASPGPSAYSVQNSYPSPSWTFGARRREHLPDSASPSRILSNAKDEGPGPGQYYLASTLSAKGFTFAKLDKNTNDPKNKIPGPGQYSTEKPRYDSPAYSLGRSSRFDDEKLRNNTPGPGAYGSEAKPGKNNATVKFSKARRNMNSDVESTPGFYKIDLKADGPFYSIQGKASGKVRDKTPVKFI